MTSVDFRNGDWGRLRGEETTKLDREILADISRRRNDLGLRWIWCIPSMFDCFVFFRDLISNLAQPTRAWADPIKIPALESWSNEARYYLKNVFIRELRFTKILFRDEIFALFNYIPDQSVVFWRGVQNLNTTKLTNHLSEKGTSNICEVRR